jgi:ammonium transporter, Amt family
VQQTCNSLLVGLVSITGCCNNVQPWAAIIIGSIGTLIYCLSCKLFEKLKIDDLLESS